MVLVFDLDDTLYDEMQFVRSGFRAVAAHGRQAFGWNEDESLRLMLEVLQREGRGQVFNQWLEAHGRVTKARVAECVHVYRHHRPQLELFPAARRVLDHYRGKVPLYLVTDGHKEVQRNKVDALGLWPEFRRVFITHRFGVHRAKPSIHCFEIIRRMQGCDWADIVYVGDNPAKDFVGLNPLGARTVRVRTGGHRDVHAKPGHDAAASIGGLDELPGVLQRSMQA